MLSIPQVSTRITKYQDSARSYIGFRTVTGLQGEEDLPNKYK